MNRTTFLAGMATLITSVAAAPVRAQQPQGPQPCQAGVPSTTSTKGHTATWRCRTRSRETNGKT